MKTTTHRGFTLTELLVVISIIAVLSSIVLVGVNQARNRGKNARAAADISQYITGLALARERDGSYPASSWRCLGAAGCQWNNANIDPASGTVTDALGAVMSSLPSSSFEQNGYSGYQYRTTGTGYSLRWFLYGENRDCDPGTHNGNMNGISLCEYRR